MFYEGDLQGGISTAVQEAKLVVCFVTDDGEESQQWENEYLQDETLKSSLSEQSILLRLQAGSTEAGFLAAIFPLPKNPTIVIIKNGELKEYLTAGVSKEDFMRRMRTALGDHSPIQSSSQAGTSTAFGENASTIQSEVAEGSTSQSSPSLDQTPSINPTSGTSVSQELHTESATVSENQKHDQESKEKAEAVAKAQARREVSVKAAAEESKPSADMKYALMQKKRQKEAREERARILKRVEDDKIERRKEEARRKAETQALTENKIPSRTGVSSSTKSTSPRNFTDCALQVRLFDGSTIRSKFPSSGSIRKDVRPWIDGKQINDVPYTFKQVLTPLPNKNIETSEEEHSLQSLGLTPSATLILLPVTEYTSAYQPGTGIVSRSVSAGYGVVSSGVGMVTGLLGSFLGGGQPPSSEQNIAPPPAPGPSINVRTLRDQREARDDQQFYNGNALNFEPRKDDDKKEE